MKQVIAVGLLAVTCIAGCDIGLAPWERAPIENVCSVEQMSRVQAESAWCIKNTDFSSMYCYGAAVIRNCPKREAAHDRQ